jgi:hypothetical protein
MMERKRSAFELYHKALTEKLKTSNPDISFGRGQLKKHTAAIYAKLDLVEKEAWAAHAETDRARYFHELVSYVPPPRTAKTGRKRKRRKDRNAPKRLSVYFLYQNTMREQFQRENPEMDFGQLATYTSQMYKKLTPQEKATWIARSQQDKARYDAELATYKPPPGYDAKGGFIELIAPHSRKSRAKDLAAPKRPSGA